MSCYHGVAATFGALADPSLARQRWVLDPISVVGNLLVDGRIPLANNYPTKLTDPLPFEPVGKPSRFLTWQWLRTKKRFGV